MTTTLRIIDNDHTRPSPVTVDITLPTGVIKINLDIRNAELITFESA